MQPRKAKLQATLLQNDKQLDCYVFEATGTDDFASAMASALNELRRRQNLPSIWGEGRRVVVSEASDAQGT